uniref:Uncharacterized protein n=2 Tax=Chrysotila carterae TaxID=13221 RepID=A0A7S4B645_CHRCT
MLRTASAVASETPSGFDSFHVLIDTMATLPDAWLGPNELHAHAPAATLLPRTADPTTSRWTNGSLDTGVCLPLYHARTSLAESGANASEQPTAVSRGLHAGWSFGALVSGFSTESNGRSARLSLPSDPPLELTVGASSADLGWLASPSMVRHDRRWAKLAECMPGRGRVDKLAVGLPRLSETPQIRVWDGSIVDKNGLAAAVARMQAECAASSANGLDCSNGLYAIVLDHDPGSAKEGPLRYKFAIPRRSFTTNGSRHDLYPYQVGDLMAIYANSAPAPAAQVFREPYPPPSEWTPWLHTAANSEYSGVYWRGALTTVDNPWYGVSAGTRVQLLVLKPNLELPTFDKPSAMPYLYQQHYGPTAAAIADAAAPIIKNFLLESRREI